MSEFLFKAWIFLIYFKIPYNLFLRSEFILYFSCRVKIMILTTLAATYFDEGDNV